MELINKHEISKIFVGRRLFLEEIQYILDGIAESGNGDFVRLLLNTPGIGKTKTIEHFGKALMNLTPFQHSFSKGTPLSNYALFVSITIANSNTLKEIYEGIIKESYDQFKTFYSKYPKLLPNVWSGQIPSGKSLQDLTISELIKIFELRTDPYNNPSLFLKSISKQIPIILHLDEFQETIHEGDKTLYNDMGIFLAGIIKMPIFSIISGTKFTIIRTIGNNRISPLNGKTKKLVLSYLPEEDQKEFSSKIITNIDDNGNKKKNIENNSINEKKLLEHFTNWIISYSGGHPRTMQIMTETFIEQIFAQDIKNQIFNTNNINDLLTIFFIKLNNKTTIELQGIFWKTKYKDFITKMSQNIPEHVQQTIIQHISTVLKIDRKLPELVETISNIPIFKNYSTEMERIKIIEDFLSILVQAGYLLINSYDNFYIPSRYALQAFLADWQEYLPNWYATFIQFSKNHLFKEIMLHSPQSFGWTSEVYVKYGILSSFGIHKQNGEAFPMNFADSYGKYLDNPIQNVPIPTSFSQREGNVSIKTIKEIPDNEYVVFSIAEAIDALIRHENIILALQITTNKSQSKLKDKFIKLNDYCKNLMQNAKNNKIDYEIVPWFISLENFEYKKVLESTDVYSGLISLGNLWE